VEVQRQAAPRPSRSNPATKRLPERREPEKTFAVNAVARDGSKAAPNAALAMAPEKSPSGSAAADAFFRPFLASPHFYTAMRNFKIFHPVWRTS